MGTLIGIVIVLSFILAAIDGATKPRRRRYTKRRNNEGDGCTGCFIVIGILICIGLGYAAVNYIRAHSSVFIVIGIAIVFIGSIIFAAYKMHGVDEPTDTVTPVRPKVFDPSKRRVKEIKPDKPLFTEEQLKANPAICENVRSTPNTTKIDDKPSAYAATYEDVVGPIPSAAEMAGKLGEDSVSKAVWAACQFDGRHYKILRNVYVPIVDGYSEIDVLLLHETGIYVFESKNLSGSIYGDDKHSRWQRYKANGEKEMIPNPVRQNKGHIDALCVFLQQNKYQFQVFSMIVFGTKANLKYVPENKSLVTIHEVYNLEMDLVRKMQSEKNFYSAETIDSWCRKLLPYTQLTEEQKKAHRERLARKYS